MNTLHKSTQQVLVALRIFNGLTKSHPDLNQWLRPHLQAGLPVLTQMAEVPDMVLDDSQTKKLTLWLMRLLALIPVTGTMEDMPTPLHVVQAPASPEELLASLRTGAELKQARIELAQAKEDTARAWQVMKESAQTQKLLREQLEIMENWLCAGLPKRDNAALMDRLDQSTLGRRNALRGEIVFHETQSVDLLNEMQQLRDKSPQNVERLQFVTRLYDFHQSRLMVLTKQHRELLGELELEIIPGFGN